MIATLKAGGVVFLLPSEMWPKACSSFEIKILEKDILLYIRGDSRRWWPWLSTETHPLS